MAMSSLDLFIIILIIIIPIVLILYKGIKIEPVKEQIDIEKNELRNRQAKLKMFIEKLDEKFASGEIDSEYHKELTEKYNIEYHNLKNQLVEKELLHDTGLEIKREDIETSYDDIKKEESRKSYGTYGAIIIIVAILIVGLWLFQQIKQRDALKDVVINVDGVDIGSIGITSAILNIRLSMYNPNSITATLDSIDYQIYGNNNYIGNGNIYQRIDIPPRQTKYVTTDFRLSYGGTLKMIWSAITKGNIDWRVSGTAHFDTPLGTLDIPFER